MANNNKNNFFSNVDGTFVHSCIECYW